jgi:excisionase family DNA binding protein
VLRAQAVALRAQADSIEAQAQVLEANVTVAPCAPEPAPLLSKQQLAAALGVSTATIDRLCREGAIPFLPVGDSRRFDLGSVRQALEARAAEELPESSPHAPEDRPSGVRVLSKRRR